MAKIRDLPSIATLGAADRLVVDTPLGARAIGGEDVHKGSLGLQRRLSHGPGGPSFGFEFAGGGYLPLFNAWGGLLTTTRAGIAEPALSASTIHGQRTLSIGLIEGRPVGRVEYDGWGSVRQAWGLDTADHWIGTPRGLERPNKDYFLGSENRWGTRSLAVAPIEGEAIFRVLYDTLGGVREAWGENGGHWIATGDGLKRANGAAFGATGTAQITYTAEPYVSGMQERLARVDQAGHAEIVILMGQSNGDGQNDAGDALVSAAPLYPNSALMLEGGPRYRTATGAPTLVPLVENVAGGGASRQQETPLSGAVNHFIRDHYAAFAVYPTVAAVSVAQGDRPYNGNKLGSDVYRNLERALVRIVAALRSRGFTSLRTTILYVGSEGDFGQTARMTPSRFMGQMRQFKRQLVETVRRATGEIGDPLLVLVQPSNTTADIWQSPVREGMRRLHGQEGIICAGPSYQFPMAAGDVIHRDNRGKYGSGILCGRAMLAERLGMSWHGVRPQGDTGYWLGDTRFAIDFDIMGTRLVLDGTGAVITTAGLVNHGLTFSDGSASPPAITAVDVDGQTLLVTLAARPTGPRPRCGYANARSVGNTTTDGPVVGARGTLRDDTVYPALSDGDQYLWSDAFIVSLPPRI